MVVADLISVEEAYGQDPVTGEIDMDKFRQVCRATRTDTGQQAPS